MIWNEERVAILTKRWEAGETSAQIAKALGSTPERIRAKRNALGLKARDGEARLLLETRGGHRPGPRVPHGQLRATPSTPKAAPAADKLKPLAGSTPRPWVQRQRGECCFPVDGGGADTLSCCLPVRKAGGIYCEGHVAIACGQPWPPQGC